MKHFKFLSLMLMAIVAMFAFTACGDDDEKDNKGGQQGGGGDTSELAGNWTAVAFTPEGGSRFEIDRQNENHWQWCLRFVLTDNEITQYAINYQGSEGYRGREEKTLIGKYRVEGNTFIIYDYYEGYHNVKDQEESGSGIMSTKPIQSTFSLSNSIFTLTIAGYGVYELQKTDGGQQGGGGDTSITADKLIGTWYGVDENSSKKISVFVMDFTANGQGHYAEFKAKADENWEPRDPEWANMTWTLSNGTLNATVNVPNKGDVTRKGDIISLNGNKMTVRRYLDDGYTDEIVMTRVNSADEFALIFAQMILEKTGGEQGGEEQGGGQGEGQGEASLLGTWKTVRIAGKATEISTGEVLESWDKYPTLDEAKDPEKESLKYMEYTFNKDGSLKVQSFDEETRLFNIIMEGTWIQNEDIVIVTLILDEKNSFSKTFNIVELTADKLTLHETHIDDEFEVHGRDGRYQVVYDENVYCTRK